MNSTAPTPPPSPSPLALRLATLLFPPAGLVLLWRSPRGVGRKLLGTVGVGLYGLLWLAGVVWLLVKFGGLEVEFQGGYVPALTWTKTRPDYAALAASRARQATLPAASPRAAGSNYWTRFRGPAGDGVYAQQPIPTNWPAAGLRLLWKQPCGGGYASFAIADGLAFTTEQRRGDEVLVAYEVATGREVWTNGWPAFFSEPLGGDGPRATPTWHAGRLFALGAAGEFRCLDAATGKLLWRRQVLTDFGAKVPTYGLAASPLIVDDTVLVLSSAGGGRSVQAYRLADGAPAWAALGDVTGYASPMLVTLAGERQVLVSCATRTVGLRPADGTLLWEVPWTVQNGQMPIAQPVLVASNRFVLAAGYFTGAAAFEVNRTAGGGSPREVWRTKSLKNKFSSSVCWQGHVYGLDEDILVCLDAATGERRWKDGRYGYGQLLLADGHLLILSGKGELALVRATPERHVELARFPAITGKTWNYPALADGFLLVRNAAEMACFAP